MPNFALRRLALMVLASASLGAQAHAACPDAVQAAAMAAAILSGTPFDAPDVTSADEARCAQDRLVAALSVTWGPTGGYKAGLTSAPAQKAFGVTEPVQGLLFPMQFLPPGARLPAAFGAHPRMEADLIAVVSDAAINQATTPEEVAANLGSIRPFIELADLMVTDPRALNGDRITAINVGARSGVEGVDLPVDAGALAAMTVVVTDQTGAELARAPGAAILGHPLNAVLWLRQAGVTFQPGDRISLGSFGPLLTPVAGQTVTVTYQGLAGTPSISVGFD